ncbi:MAG: Rne/Rng family ribonuclease [Candidatus Omnitrophica bacterium]|nr:Rne/Rng family ribonuclease [Candidatus Omnitrophota bacterium]
MSREILIQTQKGEKLVAIVQDGRLDEFHIEVSRYQPLLGNIYKGKVESILPSINAAFVNIGQAKNGFLYLTDVVSPRVDADQELEPLNFIEKIFNPQPKVEVKPEPPKPSPRSNKRFKKHSGDLPLKVGQDVLVQVVKEPFGEKGARLTTHITLPGRFIVYMPYDEQVGISKKIEEGEERKRLREVIAGLSFIKSGGFIVRTACSGQGKRELVRDAKFLHDIWQKILKKSKTEKSPVMIYEEGELTWKMVRDYLTEKVDKLVIDSEEHYTRIRQFVQTLIGPEMVGKIEFYQGKELLFEAKKIMDDLRTIYEPTVPVKSGAYVVIEQTEALTVIDVNSGRFKTRASPGEAAFMVNMEVVPEIARQLRLRDLGGIIVIDFIDMVKEDNKRRVLHTLKEALAKDYAKTEVYKISPLGLVEMTRERSGKTVESISFGRCPFCSGRGRVKIP